MTDIKAVLAELRLDACRANVELARRGLARFTFGNASAVDREHGLVAIKPSGVAYDSLEPDDLVVVDLDGQVIDGTLRPSSDLPTHLVLYRAFGSIGGVVHTHSHYATVWAQSQREIPCLGTTHADYFHGAIPVTSLLDGSQIESEYEA
jgi:L-ribulose-5-phosphate 4-epimerase